MAEVRTLDSDEIAYCRTLPFVTYFRMYGGVVLFAVYLIYFPAIAVVFLVLHGNLPGVLGKVLPVETVTADQVLQLLWITVIFLGSGLFFVRYSRPAVVLVLTLVLSSIGRTVYGEVRKFGGFDQALVQLLVHGSFASNLVVASAAAGLAAFIYCAFVLARGAAVYFLLTGPQRRLLRDPAIPGRFAIQAFYNAFATPAQVGFVLRKRAARLLLVGLSMLAALAVAVASNALQFAAAEPTGYLEAALEIIRDRCLAPGRDATAPNTCAGLFARAMEFPWFDYGAILGVIVVSLAIAWLCQQSLRRRLLVSLQDLTRSDARPPVLFLRAFADDQIRLGEPRLSILGKLLDGARFRTSLDGLLLEETTQYGPVVALGNPDDKRPPYGAARGYFDNMSWRDSVADLAKRSRAIVICLDDTDGIWWEVEHIAARDHLKKTLFLVHPKFRVAGANAWLRKKLSAFLPVEDGAVVAELREFDPEVQGDGPIGFFVGPDGSLTFLRSSQYSRFSYLLSIRSFLRGRFDPEDVRLSERIRRVLASDAFLPWVCFACGLVSIPYVSFGNIVGFVSGIAGLVVGVVAWRRMRSKSAPKERRIVIAGMAMCALFGLFDGLFVAWLLGLVS